MPKLAHVAARQRASAISARLSVRLDARGVGQEKGALRVITMDSARRVAHAGRAPMMSRIRLSRDWKLAFTPADQRVGLAALTMSAAITVVLVRTCGFGRAGVTPLRCRFLQ